MKKSKIFLEIFLIVLSLFVIFEIVIYNINNSILLNKQNQVIENYLPQDATVINSNSYIITQLDCTTKGIGYGVSVHFKSNLPYEELYEKYFNPYYSFIYDNNDYYTVSFQFSNLNNILTFCDIRVLLANIKDF